MFKKAKKIIFFMTVLAAVFMLALTVYAEEPKEGSYLIQSWDGNWYYIEDDAIGVHFSGLVQNENGWWRVEEGMVNFDAEGIYQNKNGWWYVKGGKVQFGYTGIRQNENGWWRIEEGKVNFSAEGVYQNENGWWYVSGGKVQFGYSGLKSNENGWWVIEDGRVDFGYYGTYYYDGVAWWIEGGRVIREYSASDDKTKTAASNAAYYDAPVLTNICNGPGGIRIDWRGISGVSRYRVFYWGRDNVWHILDDTANTYIIDTDVISGRNYTYTVRAVSSDGSEYLSDYDREGITFTYTYEYDSYIAGLDGNPTREETIQACRSFGLDDNEIIALIGWVEGEGYYNINEPYLNYLCACVVANGIKDGLYGHGEAALRTIQSWGYSYYAIETQIRRYETACQDTLTAVYLAVTCPTPGIYFCRGSYSKPSGCFYDPGLIIQGQNLYVW